jgi:hypothetical protein
VSLFRRAIDGVRRHPELVGIALVLDVAFLLVYGFVTQPIRNMMFNHAFIFMQSVSQQIQAATSTLSQPSMMELLLADKASFTGIAFWMLVLWLTALILYSVIEGTAWRLLQGQPKPWEVWRFGVAQLPWFLIGGVVIVLTITWGLRGAAVAAMTKTTVSTAPEWILLGVLAIVILCSFVTAAQHHPSFRKTFPLLRSKQVLQALGIVILSVIGLDLAVRGISLLHPFAGQLTGLILCLRLSTFLRLLLIEACNVHQ